MRLFFALWPPARAADQLAALAAGCARQHGGRPTRQDTIHLTLSFLGEVPEDRLPQLIETASTVAPRRFVLAIDNLGYWHHNHLLWAGCSAPPPALDELATRLHGALHDAGFMRGDVEPSFFAHITLVRKLASASEPLVPATVARVEWLVDGYSLVESQHAHAGPNYRRIADFALRA